MTLVELLVVIGIFERFPYPDYVIELQSTSREMRGFNRGHLIATYESYLQCPSSPGYPRQHSHGLRDYISTPRVAIREGRRTDLVQGACFIPQLSDPNRKLRSSVRDIGIIGINTERAPLRKTTDGMSRTILLVESASFPTPYEGRPANHPRGPWSNRIAIPKPATEDEVPDPLWTESEDYQSYIIYPSGDVPVGGDD